MKRMDDSPEEKRCTAMISSLSTNKRKLETCPTSHEERVELPCKKKPKLIGLVINIRSKFAQQLDNYLYYDLTNLVIDYARTETTQRPTHWRNVLVELLEHTYMLPYWLNMRAGFGTQFQGDSTWGVHCVAPTRDKSYTVYAATERPGVEMVQRHVVRISGDRRQEWQYAVYNGYGRVHLRAAHDRSQSLYGRCEVTNKCYIDW